MIYYYINSQTRPNIIYYLFSYVNNYVEGFSPILLKKKDVPNLANNKNTTVFVTLSSELDYQNLINYINILQSNFGEIKINIVVGGMFLSVLNPKNIKHFLPEITHVISGCGEAFLLYYVKYGLEDGIYDSRSFDKIGEYLLNKKWFDSLTHKDEGSNILLTFDENKCSWGKCSFCHHNSLSSRKHNQVPQDVFEQLMYYHKNGFNKFYFYDNYINIEKLQTLFDLIYKKGPYNEVEFSFFGAKANDNYSLLDQTILKWKRNPISDISIGVEFYNNEQLELFNKGVTVKDIDYSINWFNDNGVKPSVYLLTGMPLSKKDQRKSYRIFLDKYYDKLNQIYCSFFRLNKNIEIYKNREKYKIRVFNENYKINDFSGINIPENVNIPTNYEKFKHYDEEEQRWISRREDYLRHKDLIGFNYNIMKIDHK